VLHLSIISYQIYRALCPAASKEELALMLESLSKSLKTKGPESERLSGQIIQTLKVFCFFFFFLFLLTKNYFEKSVLEQTDVNNLTL
jgi:hypothetical protein